MDRLILSEKETAWVADTIRKITDKMEWVSEKSRNKIPYATVDGTHDDRGDKSRNFPIDDGINWWCNGFWPGMMWLMYHETGNIKYREIARSAEKKLDRCFEDYLGLHHDVGFMYLLSAVADYRLTGDEESPPHLRSAECEESPPHLRSAECEDSRRRGLHAANLLAGRFNPAGRFIRAWNDIPGADSDTRGWVIIDSMFNIPLLYWASKVTKDPRFSQIAVMHADTVMENFVREDGSVCHIVEFDPVEGSRVCDYGGQGYAQGSSWTRGQTWGLYGFTMSYLHSGMEEYLDTARKIAGYFIRQIPESGLIPVDFCQPAEPAWEDSTAAAIGASGLLELARIESLPEAERDNYRNTAVRLLQILDEKRCNWSLECDCILEKCTGAYHSPDHEFHIIYGDYYFMEAMFKLKGDDVFLW